MCLGVFPLQSFYSRLELLLTPRLQGPLELATPPLTCALPSCHGGLLSQTTNPGQLETRLELGLFLLLPLLQTAQGPVCVCPVPVPREAVVAHTVFQLYDFLPDVSSSSILRPS